MVALVKSFNWLFLALTFSLAILSLLPGAVELAEAKSVELRSARHSKHKHHAHHLQHHKHKHPKSKHRKTHKGKHHKGKNHKGKNHKGKQHKGKQHKGKNHKGKQHKGKQHKSHLKAHKPKVSVGIQVSNKGSNGGLIPFGLKAGITGEDGLEALAPYIGSYSNWKPKPWSPEAPKDVLFMPMVWGSGQSSSHDAELLHTFRSLFSATGLSRKAAPKVVIGFEEPDCPTGHGSSGVSVSTGARVWNQVMAPLKQEGTILASPSMCKQTDEDWLTPFKEKIDVHWDVTNVHVNQDNVEDVKREIDYYWDKYRKPIYVTEFACVHVHDHWDPVTDQSLINRYINDIVDYFESDDRVAMYQYSTGMGLADQWRLTKPGTKELTESGRVYRNAIKKYAGSKSSRVGIRRRDSDSVEDVDEDDNDEVEEVELDQDELAEEEEDEVEEDDVEDA
ncbi:hypothetical protein CF326_g4494 [Tilletia indica]|uniref:Asl1-like glycosyl hydrolase catalytic domain-containing protein n=1 Tax=Tilletia indica TaxID=43049 RepID=A0A177TVG3_9BASI|nr:hypothetical protein CF326_g4494 [Tilletia indica]KAE8246889.1 hypothetical protein A4X13_0g5580 [Tilletia indica]